MSGAASGDLSHGETAGSDRERMKEKMHALSWAAFSDGVAAALPIGHRVVVTDPLPATALAGG